jgi:hypothetical protein
MKPRLSEREIVGTASEIWLLHLQRVVLPIAEIADLEAAFFREDAFAATRAWMARQVLLQ